MNAASPGTGPTCQVWRLSPGRPGRLRRAADRGLGHPAEHARNLSCELGQANQRPKLLIYDRDSEFAAGFGDVFRSETH